jgi:hypothetical protein
MGLSVMGPNIHRGRGRDGVTDPVRAADVLVQAVAVPPARPVA